MAHLEQLAQKAKEGKLALLVGLDLGEAATGLPSGVELTRGLTAKFRLPVSDSLATVAQGLKERNQQWRYAGYLEQKLPAGGEPGPLHEAVASLPVPFFLTAAYDDRLARALEAAGHPANLLIEDDDLSRRKPGCPDLIKLCGDLNRLHTLVVAEDEYADLLLDDDRRDLFDRAGEWLREKSVLLVGCDPTEGSDFENWLYWEVLKRLGAFGAPSCLVWPDPAADDVARWADRDVTVIDVEPVVWLESLAAALESVAVVRPKEKKVAALEGLVHMLGGVSAKDELSADVQQALDVALQQVPVEQRPRSIRATFTFRLTDDDKLRAALDLEYDPDIAPYHRGEFRETGITLQRLQEWATEAKEGREAWDLPQETLVEQEGIKLFDAILPADSKEREQYDLALQLGQVVKAALYFVFQPEDDLGRLSPIPWELMHDGLAAIGRGFLGLKYPVYRRLPSFTSLGQATGRIEKALVVAADPTQRLGELSDEVGWLVATLRDAGVAQVDACRPDDEDVSDPEAIKALLRDGDYQLFHFAGHGQFNDDDPSQSKLLLGRAGERGKELTAAALAEVARESELILVFLSACEVGRPARREASQPWKEAGITDALIRAGVPVTVGMRWIIGDDNSKALVETFYEELLKEKPAERALMIARQAVENEPDWANPVLTKRHGVL